MPFLGKDVALYARIVDHFSRYEAYRLNISIITKSSEE